MNFSPVSSSAHALRCFSSLLVTSLVCALLPQRTVAASVMLTPSKDNTIYGDGSVSNGAGPYLFAGSSGEKRVLRGLIAFDLAGQIPAGATINSVTLTLSVNTPLPANSNTVRLHRVTAEWGEGTSSALMGGG